MYRSSAIRITVAAPSPRRVASATNSVGAERDRRPAARLLLGELEDGRVLGVLDLSEHRVGLGLVLVDPVRVGDAELLLAVARVRLELPERGRLELLDRLVPLDEQREGRRLDAADGEEAPPPRAGGEREVPREERAPDEVDLLTGRGGGGEGMVDVLRGAGSSVRSPRA